MLKNYTCGSVGSSLLGKDIREHLQPAVLKMFLSSLLFVGSLAASASASPLQPRQDTNASTPTPSVVSANYDGHCFYPVPSDKYFNLTNYLGRWYQLAGTVAPFTAGCSCIYAEYSLNTNSTVNVHNGCQLNETDITIQGTATPVDAGLGYGTAGAFRVKFPQSPEEECPGPNYIVQEYSWDYGWAIVQASNFSTLFVLSREQQREEADLDVSWVLHSFHHTTARPKLIDVFVDMDRKGWEDGQ